MTIKYVMFTTVVDVTQHVEQKWKGGVGEKAVFEPIPRGYYVHMEGSYEALHVGPEMPDIRTGDRIKITVEKVHERN